MAAIPDAGGARCAPCGVLRARLPRVLLRVAVLGALVITGWLLGSGIAHASAFSGLSGVNEARIAPLSPLNATETDEGSDALLGGSGTVTSAVMRAVPVGRLPVQPARVPALAPVLEPVSKLAAPAPLIAGNKTRSQAEAPKPAAVPPPAAPAPQAEPIAPATAVTTPAPVQHTVSDAPSETPVHAAAVPVADPLADQIARPAALGPSASGSDPTAPVPASPPGTTTAPCAGGNAGGGSTTKSDQSVALSDGWGTTGSTPTLCRLCAGASDIPPSAAQRPSTSPD